MPSMENLTRRELYAMKDKRERERKERGRARKRMRS